MSTHEERSELVGAYVLDALTPEENEAFTAHLRDCEICRGEVAELQQVVGVLPLTVEAVEPPPDLRARILAEAERDLQPGPSLRSVPGGVADSARPPRTTTQPARGRRSWWVQYATPVAAAAVLVIAALGVWNIRLQQQVNDQRTSLSLQRQVAAAIASGATVSRMNGTRHAPSASGAMVQPSHAGRAYLIVKGLPRVKSDKVYELWLIKGSTPRPAGTFSYSGSQAQVFRVPTSARGFALTAVTVEPKPGGKSPTGRQVLLGRLAA